jgi:hypothetical protein
MSQGNVLVGRPAIAAELRDELQHDPTTLIPDIGRPRRKHPQADRPIWIHMPDPVVFRLGQNIR